MFELAAIGVGLYLLTRIGKKNIIAPGPSLPDESLPPNRRSGKGKPCSLPADTTNRDIKCKDEMISRATWNWENRPVFFTKVPLSPGAANAWKQLDQLYKEFIDNDVLAKFNRAFEERAAIGSAARTEYRTRANFYRKTADEFSKDIEALAKAFESDENKFVKRVQKAFGTTALNSFYQKRKNEIFSGVFPANNTTVVPPFPMDITKIDPKSDIITEDTGFNPTDIIKDILNK